MEGCTIRKSHRVEPRELIFTITNNPHCLGFFIIRVHYNLYNLGSGKFRERLPEIGIILISSFSTLTMPVSSYKHIYQFRYNRG